MRLFQNSGLYPSYRRRLDQLAANATTFQQRLSIFLADRYGACHYLKPVLDGSPQAFFTNGDDQTLQQMWAREQGLHANTKLDEILLAQIEAHQTEVFYNLDPMRYGSAFIRRLPSCVKKTICWRAAPSAGGDFREYDLLVNNFPSILATYAKDGMRTAYFSPAHDPEMDTYAINQIRPIDVLFVGGYSRHHRNRAVILEAVATLRDHFNIVFCLERSRITRLAESPLGWLLPIKRHIRPKGIRLVTKESVYGRDLYAQLAKAKIVLNGAIDMAGKERGNMRCFEAMGCGALLVSDTGNYPDGMVNNETMLTYTDAHEVTRVIESVLYNWEQVRKLAINGCCMLHDHYSKERQWQAFLGLMDEA